MNAGKMIWSGMARRFAKIGAAIACAGTFAGSISVLPGCQGIDASVLDGTLEEIVSQINAGGSDREGSGGGSGSGTNGQGGNAGYDDCNDRGPNGETTLAACLEADQPTPPGDSDGDGVPDKSDNCPNTANADQLDTNGDGIGDVCAGGSQPTPGPGGGLPAGALSVVTVGDSLTEGTGDADGRGYPGTLLDRLGAARPGSTVLNLGRYGWTSGELINGTDLEPSQLDRAVAQLPDVVCVWIGSNDLFRLYENGPDNGTSAADEAADLAQYTANIDAIVSRLTAAGARVLIGLIDDQALRPVRSDRATLPNTTEAEFNQMSAQVVRYNQAIRSIAQRYDATVVDFYNTTIFTSEATLDYDGIHPNSDGYDIIAGMWYSAMQVAR